MFRRRLKIMVSQAPIPVPSPSEGVRTEPDTVPDKLCPRVEEKSVKERSGCLGLLLELGAWVASTVLTTIGVLMLLVGALTFGPSMEPVGVVLIVAAPVAAYVLIRVGRDILGDLRRPK